MKDLGTLTCQVETRMPTPYGHLRIRAYSTLEDDPQPHMVLIKDPVDMSRPVLVRIHSECMTGDVFGSQRCDCGDQLDRSMEMISQEGGILIYLRQEGRGIGIINKLKAYNLQDDGSDTAEANTHLGFEVDGRSFDVAVGILMDLGAKAIRLLTNNPSKISAFDRSPVRLIERVPLEITPHHENKKYLETKKNVMGHLLKLR